MPLPHPVCSRIPVHTRSVSIHGYLRGDGLWDIEAHLTDIKTQDHDLAAGVRPAGAPIHDMWVRITVDEDYLIHDAIVLTDERPYPGACETINERYAQLKGLNLVRGFRQSASKILGGAQGCTHLNELLWQLPTATIQSMVGRRTTVRPAATQPFPIDRCHALVSHGETVRRFYPKWYRPSELVAKDRHEDT